MNRDARGKWDRGGLPVNPDHPDLLERWGNRVDLDYPGSRDQIWPPVPSARPPTAPCPKSPFTQGSKNSTRATSCWSLTTWSRISGIIMTPPRANSPAPYREYTSLPTMCSCEEETELACGLICARTTRWARARAHTQTNAHNLRH